MLEGDNASRGLGRFGLDLELECESYTSQATIGSALSHTGSIEHLVVWFDRHFEYALIKFIVQLNGLFFLLSFAIRYSKQFSIAEFAIRCSKQFFIVEFAIHICKRFSIFKSAVHSKLVSTIQFNLPTYRILSNKQLHTQADGELNVPTSPQM